MHEFRSFKMYTMAFFMALEREMHMMCKVCKYLKHKQTCTALDKSISIYGT